MGSISGETIDWEGQDSGAREEKIYVSVRLRPLNERELAHNDVSDWECINDTTVIFKNSYHERSSSPTAYSFDRVFRTDCPTSQVYEDAAKKVVLSVLSGINSTIFAYGQTSSGKTFTMSGITEFAIEDMYNYIDKHRERDFILKFSAMEIYNEAVKDLINTDNTQLRLLDDPERGTVVDKLTEVTLRDARHLRELLSMCEAQRQTGETALNELSSRSHQILRLRVESEAREFFGVSNTSTLTASVNFVDLAGSERASQTNSAGTRLKEGCHINRSLLTLGTVIRKLSKGRNGHVPYRNSKLTRILQNSLGGNAKTAIICTMSPAHSHVEQSRNTLLFASCAKQVSTNAQVNVVMSEKALVKHLQKELARMENELKSLRGLRSVAKPGDSTSALKEKELLIEKMDKEIRDLTHQRDLAQSRAETNMLHSGELHLHESKSWMHIHNLNKGSWGGSEYTPRSEYTASESDMIDSLRSDTASCISHYSDRYDRINSPRYEHVNSPRYEHVNSPRYERVNSVKNEDRVLENNEEQLLADDTSPTLYIDKYFGPDPCRGWEKVGQEIDKNSEDNCKEVPSTEVHNESNTVSAESASDVEYPTSGQSPCSSDDDSSDSNNKVTRSKSCAAILTTVIDEVAKENEDTLQDEEFEQGKVSDVAPMAHCETVCTKDNETSVKSEIMVDIEEDTKILGENSTENQQDACVTELDEVINPITSKVDLESEDEKTSNSMEITANDDLEKTQDLTALETSAEDTNQAALEKTVDEDSNEADDSKATEEISQDDGIAKAQDIKPSEEKADETQSTKSSESEKITDDNLENVLVTKSASDWSVEFERQKREIIELWDICNIPLVHRTYFFLLFNGDPSDAIYMEVELRRLSFIKNTLNGATSAKDVQLTRASSLKTLNRERDMLCKQMLKKITTKEREALYEKWGIDLKSKQRRVQLCRQLWTDATDMENIKESASVIAKLVGLKEPGQAPKEMVGLSFSERTSHARSFSWKTSLI